jgi:nucleotide-binding universal stress UspA family protein
MLMGFLFPAFLAVLPVLLVPVLLHLLDRWRARPLVLPTVRFLFGNKTGGSAARKLHKPLLLLIRTVSLVLLVMVFAVPHCGKKIALPSAERVLVVVDNSPSMQRIKDGRRLLDRAVDEAGRLGALLSSRGCEVLSTGLDGHDPGRIGKTVEPAVALAAALKRRPGVSSVILISDFKRSLWGDSAVCDRVLYVRPIGHPTLDNASIAALALEEGLLIEGEAVQAEAVLATSGMSLEVRWRLLINGQAVAEGRSTAVPAGTRLGIPFVVPQAGLLALRLEIEGDGFAADNARMALFAAHARFRIRRLGLSGDSGYLDAGLSAALGGRLVYGENDADLVVAGGDGLRAEDLQRARQADLPVLLFLPADADALPIRNLLGLLPVNLPVESGVYDQELTKLIPDEEKQPMRVSAAVRARWRFLPVPDAGAVRVLAEARDGAPLGWYLPGGPLALLAFRPLPGETQLVLQPEFPVFLRRLIGRMTGQRIPAGPVPDPLPAGFLRTADRLEPENIDPRESQLDETADRSALARLAPQVHFLDDGFFPALSDGEQAVPAGSFPVSILIGALSLLKILELVILGKERA